MAENIRTIIRFATPQGTESPTVWRDCLPPRAGDTTQLEHLGRKWVVQIGAASIGWETVDGSPAQVFGVCYKPLSTVSDAIADGLVGPEGC